MRAVRPDEPASGFVFRIKGLDRGSVDQETQIRRATSNSPGFAAQAFAPNLRRFAYDEHTLRIPVEALRRLSTILFDRLEVLGHAEVEIREDFYWEVDRAQRHNLDVEPENLNVGQLTEDWSNLEELVREEGRRVASGLSWLASILREVGETLPE